MRKVKMLNRISIDGYFASLNEETYGMDWFIHDPDTDQAAHERGGQMDTLLLGRATFELFERSWVPVLHDPGAPNHAKAIAKELTDMKKIVFSSTVRESAWENTRFHDGDLIGVVRRLKQESDTDILLLGSGSLVKQLAEEGLIDEYLFIVTPVVAGQGHPLFHHVGEFGLRLRDANSFKSGNVLLHYEIAK